MSSVISDRVDEIIRKRNEKVAKIETALANLDNAEKAVKALEAFKEKYRFDKIGAGRNYDFSESIQSISTKKFFEKSVDYRDKLKKLKERFGRDRINISFVGRAGMGKSLIMQRISGLDGKVIPAADGSDCTGAKSVIRNKDCDTHADIELMMKECR